MFKFLARFFTPPQQPPVVQVVFRLTADEYKLFENAMPTPIVDARSSDAEVAYRLGVQHVLKHLRTGYVVG